MADQHVVLFDVLTGGHHLKNVRYIATQLLETGYKVTFLTARRDPKIEIELGKLAELRVEYLEPDIKGDPPRNPIRLFVYLWKALTLCFRFCKRWGATHVVFLYLDYIELPLLLRTLTWRKGEWHLFGLLVWPYWSHSSNLGLLKKVYRLLRRNALRFLLSNGYIDVVFVHTEWAKLTLLGVKMLNSKLGARVVVVPDPCEPLEEPISKQEARSRLHLPQSKPLLLFFGRLRWDKGIDILFKALEECDGEFVLVVAGQPGYAGAEEVEGLKASLKGTCRVIARLQYIEPFEEKLYFYAADTVILPYRRVFQGTSGVLQNAIAAGRPVIATDVGLIGEIVRKYSLGIVVEPESPAALAGGIMEFLKRRSELSEVVRRSASGYTHIHHWRRMAALVEASLGEKGE